MRKVLSHLFVPILLLQEPNRPRPTFLPWVSSIRTPHVRVKRRKQDDRSMRLSLLWLRAPTCCSIKAGYVCTRACAVSLSTLHVLPSHNQGLNRAPQKAKGIHTSDDGWWMVATIVLPCSRASFRKVEQMLYAAAESRPVGRVHRNLLHYQSNTLFRINPLVAH